jgi:hypothetical protein
MTRMRMAKVVRRPASAAKRQRPKRPEVLGAIAGAVAGRWRHLQHEISRQLENGCCHPDIWLEGPRVTKTFVA